MNKTRRIIISLSITLIILVVTNILFNNFKSEQQILAYVFTKGFVKGEKITESSIKKIMINEKIDNVNLITDINGNFYARQNINEGQLLTQNLVSKTQSSDLIDYEYISLPITNSDDALSYKIQKGSKVNVYFSAKLKQVSNVLKTNFAVTYSTEDNESIVTAKLYEKVDVVNVVDSVGNENSLFTQVILLIKKEDIPMLVNLKQLGTFTLTLTE